MQSNNFCGHKQLGVTGIYWSTQVFIARGPVPSYMWIGNVPSSGGSWALEIEKVPGEPLFSGLEIEGCWNYDIWTTWDCQLSAYGRVSCTPPPKKPKTCQWSLWNSWVNFIPRFFLKKKEKTSFAAWELHVFEHFFMAFICPWYTETCASSQQEKTKKTKIQEISYPIGSNLSGLVCPERCD